MEKLRSRLAYSIVAVLRSTSLRRVAHTGIVFTILCIAWNTIGLLVATFGSSPRSWHVDPCFFTGMIVFALIMLWPLVHVYRYIDDFAARSKPLAWFAAFACWLIPFGSLLVFRAILR